MYWTLVDGVPMPHLVGGHPALDFCNTWAGWGEPPEPRREWTPDYRRLVTWTQHAGLIDPQTAARLRRTFETTSAATDVVEAAHTLRSDLYRYLAGQRSPKLFTAVARRVDAAAGSRRLALHGGACRWELAESVEAPLHAIALAVGDLLTTVDLATIGRCPGDDCGWLFASRHRRRWCSMATCGNRAKVRAHAGRQRSSDAAQSSLSRSRG